VAKKAILEKKPEDGACEDYFALKGVIDAG
jgi:hypothetical protein